jgi:hypothetical protein
MRAALIALLLTFASQAEAECGKLCDDKWWETVTTADVQAELAAGADIMARDESGKTPLHSAAAAGTPANIQALLAAGAEVMARNIYGLTPLHWAVQNHAPAVQALLDAGADVMAREKYGDTPLHVAANCWWCGSTGVIQALRAAVLQPSRALLLSKVQQALRPYFFKKEIS